MFLGLVLPTASLHDWAAHFFTFVEVMSRNNPGIDQSGQTEMTTAFRPLASAVAVAILSIVLWDVYPLTELPCDASQPDCPPFSESYFHARQAFRNAAASAGAAQESLLVYTDPATGLDYTMDVAILPASSSESSSEAGAEAPPAETPLLMHMSGVHGVEGFAGSAVQVAALREMATSGAAMNQSRPFTTCFVHAVNPYGFAALRRFNENNVDLNRNNLTPEQWKQVHTRHTYVLMLILAAHSFGAFCTFTCYFLFSRLLLYTIGFCVLFPFVCVYMYVVRRPSPALPTSPATKTLTKSSTRR